ncbi:MAG: type IV pilus assembly protein PilO [Candidatus Electronema aureum]|jgi:type IV pilus assembly protein PilO|uniref:Type IV pilus assembly protein PilO n=1 Tax=Candidatus Electronema aureum TaxID=2005002 RepID=A0A521G3M1_9BACT|nr:MAG: type IV pilus assembly protein PilO [Candidatus Electronema aureum]
MASEKFAVQLDKFVNEKYIPWKKNVKIALAAGLIIAPIAAFIFLFYNPTQQEIATLEETKSKLDAEVKEAETAAANIDHHREELKRATQKFEEISGILPKGPEIPALLRSISDLGKRAGLDFISFVPGTETPKDFYAEIPISISIRGPYHNVGYFLGEVSGLERLVTVNNINMGGPQEVDGDIMLNSSCNLLTYRYTGQAAAPPPAAAK